MPEFPFLEFRNEMKILDIGCGSGQDLTYLKSRFRSDCYGVDIALDRTMKTKSGEGISFVLADASYLPFKDDLFDVVYSFGTIEHTQRTNECIRESFRVLKTGGQVLHTVPNMFSLHTLLARPMLMSIGKWDLGLERSFTLSEFHEMFRRTGFWRIRYEIIPFGVQATVRQILSFEGITRIFKVLDNFVSDLIPFWGFFTAMNGTKPLKRGARVG